MCMPGPPCHAMVISAPYPMSLPQPHFMSVPKPSPVALCHLNLLQPIPANPACTFALPALFPEHPVGTLPKTMIVNADSHSHNSTTHT